MNSVVVLGDLVGRLDFGVWALIAAKGAFRGLGEWRKSPFSAGFLGIFGPLTRFWRKSVFADANFPSEKPRKTRGFPRSKKTLKNFSKIACIENPVLISYSPVAPLKAMPNGGATIDL